MSLNKYMHPRNRYKNKKPSFLELALKYPDFRKQVTQDESGKVFLDFKNADALRALTTCLLKEDFDLTVYLPPDRLVPTLPLRLNYIHWIEDIVGNDPGKWGIDIGTGASCVYPLLASKTLKWKFLASEADPENYFHAMKNVQTNSLEELIQVKQVTSEDILLKPVESFVQVENFDFCMCNPPFFADHMEAQAITNTRSLDRPEANSMSTASPQECIAQGGEVGFVRQMIEESVILKHKIKLFSSMVGKKSSLVHLKEELRQHKVPKFSTTEFCQGKTMRWGIAWSFDESIQFPKSPFENRKEKPPLQFVVPQGAGGVGYRVHAIAGFLKTLLASMKIHCYQGKAAKSYTSITLTAVENTWCHQRRKRREKKRQERTDKNTSETSEKVDGVNVNKDKEKESIENVDKNMEVTGNTRKEDTDLIEPTTNPSQPSTVRNVLLDEEVIQSDKIEDTDVDKRKRSLSFGDTEPDLEKLPTKVLKLENLEEDISLKEKDEKSRNQICTSASTNEFEEKTRKNPQESSSIENLTTDVGENSFEEEDEIDAFESPKNYILKCVLRLKRAGDKINMELEWLDGESRELMHQIKTFLVNRLSQKTEEAS